MFKKKLANWYSGRSAERLARRYLKKTGYSIVETNARVGCDEIDIVALDNDTLVFVEVKFRLQSLSDAVLALDHQKRRRLRRAIYGYLNREGIREVPFRLDLVAITERDGKKEVIHLQHQDASD